MSYVIQFIHPGCQCEFNPKKPNGYIQDANGNWIRLWNNGGHCRKFIKHPGCYVDPVNLNVAHQSDALYFWGEWESYSKFTPISNNNNNEQMPNGCHELFYALPKGTQNTDPYVFGDHFKYCICSQKGVMLQLQCGDLILFGTNYPLQQSFYVDTIFVVSDKNIPSSVIQNCNGNGIPAIINMYWEVTLGQLKEYLKAPVTPSPNKVYLSRQWREDPSFFSFVPCKLDDCGGVGFERLKLEWGNFNTKTQNKEKLDTNKQGKKNLNDITPQEVWNIVVDEAHKQGFMLGVHFNEPGSVTLHPSVAKTAEDMIKAEVGNQCSGCQDSCSSSCT